MWTNKDNILHLIVHLIIFKQVFAIWGTLLAENIFIIQFYMTHFLNINFSLMQKIALNNGQNRKVLV